MLHIGEWNKLKVVKDVDFGLYLDDTEDGEILLPNRYVPEDATVGDELEVFIYSDSEDRLIATTEGPIATVGQFALLKVKSVERVGAFLDWGLLKDLLLPYREQSRELHVGDSVLVYIYLDNTERICASMRIERHIEKSPGDYQPGQKVELMIAGKTELGYKAIIDGRHFGVIFANEVFQPLRQGQIVEGFIKQVRPDGKIDLSLQKTGHTAGDDIAPKIIDMLKQKGGFLAITDKTAPETIYRLFGASKKKFKIALGGLYKNRKIVIGDDGIRIGENW